MRYLRYILLLLPIFSFLKFNFIKAISDIFSSHTITHLIYDLPRGTNPLDINSVNDSFNQGNKDIAELIYSGLMKYDDQQNLVPDLAQSYKIENNKIIFKLKPSIRWISGDYINTDDIVETISQLSGNEKNEDQELDPRRFFWRSVKVNKISDREIEFIFQSGNPNIFLKNFVQKITPRNDVNSLGQAMLISSGPYYVSRQSIPQIGDYKLKINPYYFDKLPTKEIELIVSDDPSEIFSETTTKSVASRCFFSQNGTKFSSVFLVLIKNARRQTANQPLKILAQKGVLNGEKEDILNGAIITESGNPIRDFWALNDQAFYDYFALDLSIVKNDYYGFIHSNHPLGKLIGHKNNELNKMISSFYKFGNFASGEIDQAIKDSGYFKILKEKKVLCTGNFPAPENMISFENRFSEYFNL